jgi:ZIP family zinc transporter/zinc and cadmium transporter
LLVHLFEHSVTAHFHFGEETHAGEFTRRHVPYSVVGGLAIHTFFDGIAIGSSFLVSSWLGWVVFVAVFMHKVPEGLTAASIMVAAGEGKKAAMISAGCVGVASIIGVLVIESVPFGLQYALPLSAGVTLYVAATDLLPEVNREPGIRMAGFVFLGSAVVLVLQLVFRNTLP